LDTSIALPNDREPEPLSHDRQLELLSEARALIARARTVPEAKDIRDKMQAIERYYRQQQDAEDAALDAGELKLRAERKLGELLAGTVVARGNHSPGVSGSQRSLPDGIEPIQSHRWQRAASVPERDFEEHLRHCRESGEMTASPLYQLARQRDREARRAGRRKARGRAAAGADDDRCRVEEAECLDFFARQPADSIDLVFGSPQYEDARLYLEDGEDQGIALDRDAWVALMVEVYKAALRCCTGLVAFVVDGRTKDYRWSCSPARLITALDDAGICLRKPPIFERVGIPGSGGPDWLRNDYELVVCATRGGELPWSDNTAMGAPPKFGPGGDPSHRTADGSRVNRAGLGATRGRVNGDPINGYAYHPPDLANPGNVIRCKVGGGNMGDPLCHDNEAPFPEELARFFVRSFCPPGGLVCDPFCGSGTTLAVAVAEGRRATGCDRRRSQVELTRQRLAAAAGA
jgi:hypothetical protein